MLKDYGAFKVFNDDAAQIQDWNASGAQYLRVELPSSANSEILMQQQGFYFADRTIKASVSLNKCSIDLDKFIRLPIIETSEYKNEILQIAEDSFLYDRRFHVAPLCSKDISRYVLKEYVNNLDKVLVAIFKDKPIGFLALQEEDISSLFVYLAAVDEKYRMSGAAMALYATACKTAYEKGYKKLNGRISSQNMAVLNLYTALGAIFSEPKDIFIKEIKDDIK